MFSYVATCDFLFPLGHCFIQTMAGLAVSVCFVTVGHEEHLLLSAKGWCQACSLGDLSFILSDAWMEWVRLLGGGTFTALVCQMNCEGLFYGGGFWKNDMVKGCVVWEQWEIGRRAVVLRQGLQVTPLPSQWHALPTKTLSQSMKRITAVWLNNKVMGNWQNSLGFV